MPGPVRVKYPTSTYWQSVISIPFAPAEVVLIVAGLLEEPMVMGSPKAPEFVIVRVPAKVWPEAGINESPGMNMNELGFERVFHAPAPGDVPAFESLPSTPSR
jgi:hypothetical protein